MSITSQEVRIPYHRMHLHGDLVIPENFHALVIFSEGSKNVRFSLHNQQITKMLNGKGIATLLIDLFSTEQESVTPLEFKSEILFHRLLGVTNYMRELPLFRNVPIGYFGIDIGAVATIKASFILKTIGAVVIKDGRPDLAESMLPYLTTPTLLLVATPGSALANINNEAFKLLKCKKEIIYGTYTNPIGKVEKDATIATQITDWFSQHLVRSRQASPGMLQEF